MLPYQHADTLSCFEPDSNGSASSISLPEAWLLGWQPYVTPSHAQDL